jgi:acyl-CoA reductase-like NAD-dependent aldehyde dehydrogenase
MMTLDEFFKLYEHTPLEERHTLLRNPIDGVLTPIDAYEELKSLDKTIKPVVQRANKILKSLYDFYEISVVEMREREQLRILKDKYESSEK